MPPHVRSFGMDDSALDTDNETPAASAGEQTPQTRRILGRISFGHNQHRPSFTARWMSNVDEEGGFSATPTSERPPIPSALQPSGEAYTTPLPVLSMIVLSIVR